MNRSLKAYSVQGDFESWLHTVTRLRQSFQENLVRHSRMISRSAANLEESRLARFDPEITSSEFKNLAARIAFAETQLDYDIRMASRIEDTWEEAWKLEAQIQGILEEAREVEARGYTPVGLAQVMRSVRQEIERLENTRGGSYLPSEPRDSTAADVKAAEAEMASRGLSF